MLWLSIHLPQLPLDLLARGGRMDDPLVVTDLSAAQARVLLCNEAARRAGVRPGMPAPAARALADRLLVQPRDPAAEAHALHSLAAWSGQFTSLLSVDAPAGLLLEIEGSLTLFGGMHALLQRIRKGLRELGLQARLAVAPTPLAAAWLACSGKQCVLQGQGSLIRRLAQLPLSVLQLQADVLARLQGMGLSCLGDCLRLPRDGLARRVGPDVLLQLDRALGNAPDPRLPFAMPTEFHATQLLPAEVADTPSLLFALHRLLLELGGTLRAQCAGVRDLTLCLLHEQRPLTELTLQLTEPCADTQQWLRLWQARLDVLELPAPVHTLELHGSGFELLSDQHPDLFRGATSVRMQQTALLQRLRARMGDEAVRGVQVVAEHRPEYAWNWCTPGDAGAELLIGERPVWLLPEPRPLQTRAQRPFLDVPLRLQPQVERIHTGWWDGREVGRDYFIAQGRDGARFWVYRELAPPRDWYLHGVFG